MRQGIKWRCETARLLCDQTPIAERHQAIGREEVKDRQRQHAAEGRYGPFQVQMQLRLR